MTRTQAANKIASAIEDGGYSVSTWTTEGDDGHVRIYVTKPGSGRKKPAQKMGYVEVMPDGTLQSHLDRQSGTIMSMIPNMEIQPATAKPRIESPKKTTEAIDDFERQMRQSEESLSRGERD